MRDIEDMKIANKKYDKFLNEFDKYIYKIVQEGYAFAVHGCIKTSGFKYSKVMLTDEMKKSFKINSDFTYVIMQEDHMGLINTYLVSSNPTGFGNELQSRHTRYKSEKKEGE